MKKWKIVYKEKSKPEIKVDVIDLSVLNQKNIKKTFGKNVTKKGVSSLNVKKETQGYDFIEALPLK